MHCMVLRTNKWAGELVGFEARVVLLSAINNDPAPLDKLEFFRYTPLQSLLFGKQTTKNKQTKQNKTKRIMK